MTVLQYITGPAGKIEMMVSHAPLVHKTVAIICHPHPLFEGTMHNKVVTTMAKAFELIGLPTVRFNFRGVGQSAGVHDSGLGEQDDLKAVIAWVQNEFSGYAVWLAGFSFGAYITASVANQLSPTQLISIAPGVHHSDYTTLTNIHCPWLVIQGDADEIVPPADVFAWAANPPSPLELVVFKETGHFFHGKLVPLRELLVERLKFC